MITDDQKAFWDAFGFLYLPQRFSKSEVNDLKKAAIEVIEKEGGRDAFYNAPTWAIGAFAERHHVLTDWLADDRIYGIPEKLLGPDFFLETNAGSVFWSNTSWHGGFQQGDTSETVHMTSKTVMYFDSLNQNNGSLLVIPGTHRFPMGTNIKIPYSADEDLFLEEYGVSSEEIPCVSLDTEPGDIIVFSERTYHASFGSAKGRLQISAEYGANPSNHEQISAIKKDYADLRYSFHPVDSYVNNANPRIRRMVSKLIELGFPATKISEL
jgi:hypothetical protein